MQQPERRPPAYLQRVLVDGARPAQVRGGARALLGGREGGMAGAATGMAPDFVYARPAIQFLDTLADSPINAGQSPAFEFPPLRPSAPSPAYRSEPAAVPGDGARPEVVIARDVTRAPQSTSPHPTGRHAVDREPTVTTATAVRSTCVAPHRSAAASPSSIVVAVPKGLDVPVERHDPTSSRTTRVTDTASAADKMDSQASHEAHDSAPATFPIDIEKLPPAMRALMPLLGRIRAADANPLPASDSAGAELKPVVTSPPSRLAPTEKDLPDTSAASPSRPRERLEANALPRPASPEVSTRAAPPPAAMSRAGLVPQQAITQLRKAVHALAAKATAARPVVAVDTPAAAHEPKGNPVQRVERVVMTRVVSRAPVTRAFWERRYLGRPHMRAFR